MDKEYIIIAILATTAIFGYFLIPIDGYIPPTNAFQKIFTDSGNVTAQNSTAKLWLVGGTNTTVTANYATNTITVTASAGSGDTTNIWDINCGAGMFLKSFTNSTHPNFVCATPATPGSTFDTMQNIGTGQAAVYAGNTTDTNFTFKTLKQGDNISLANNTNDVTITAAGWQNNTASNVGGDYGWFKNKTGVNLFFKSIKAGSNIVLNNNTNDITINSIDSGEVNTASNVGTGEGSIFKQKSGVDLQFKTLKQARGITITNNTSDVTLGTSFYADSKTCSGNDRFTAYNNATGVYTCTTDPGLTAAVTSINADTAAAQTISGTANHISVTDTGVGALTLDTLFKVANQTCSGTNKISSFNNVTGVFVCTADSGLTAAVTSINADTSAAQTIAGTANQITVSDAGATHTINVGTDIVQIDQANTYNSAMKQTFTPSATTAGINIGTTSAYPTSPRKGDIDIAGALLKYNDNTNTTQTVDVLSQAQTWLAKKTGTPSSTTASLNLGTLASDPSSPRQGDIWISGSSLKYNDNTNTTRTALLTAVTSLNGDTSAAQTIAGTTNQITVSDAGATHTINVGSDIVQIDQANSYTDGNMQTFTDDDIRIGDNTGGQFYTFSTGDVAANRVVSLPVLTADDTFVFANFAQTLDSKTLTTTGSVAFGSDPADAGDIRASNGDSVICMEASPAGTDQCISNNASEDWVWDTNWNNINMNSNPMTNVVWGGQVNANGQTILNTGTLTLPTTTGTLVETVEAATFITNGKTFNDNILKIRNPADSFSYSIRSSAITANRDLTLPLTRQTETIAVTPPILNAAPSNPAGTSSTTGVMAGIGGTCTITPQTTGRVYIIVSAEGTTNTGDDGFGFDLRYGTGTAPTNGAALTGTVLRTLLRGSDVASSTTTATLIAPITEHGIASSLTLGTAIWIDIGQRAVTGGTATFTNVHCNAFEL